MTLGAQFFKNEDGETKPIFHKMEKVEALWRKGSNKWLPAKIKSHDNYFTEYFVYFEDGRTKKLPPERIRSLRQLKIDEGLTDEQKILEFYKMIGCNELETDSVPANVEKQMC